MKKINLISLSLVMAATAFICAAQANSTIYTDDLGRMHFLGKDPSIYLRDTRFETVDTQEKKDFNDIIYKNETAPNPDSETKVNTTEPASESAVSPVNETKGHTNKSKGSFTYNKGAMDASDPYTFGETNIQPKSKENNSQEKKHFWDNW